MTDEDPDQTAGEAGRDDAGDDDVHAPAALVELHEALAFAAAGELP